RVRRRSSPGRRGPGEVRITRRPAAGRPAPTRAGRCLFVSKFGAVLTAEQWPSRNSFLLQSLGCFTTIRTHGSSLAITDISDNSYKSDQHNCVSPCKVTSCERVQHLGG